MPSTFGFPVNILGFNRPKYFEKVLESLTRQTVQVDPSLTTIWIDGYRGSRDESRNRTNNTEKTIQLATNYFPGANLVIREHNFGIAMQYREAEAQSFRTNADIAFFFEEDLVLSPHYLEALIDLEIKTRNFPQIGRIAAHGYIKDRKDFKRTTGVGQSMKTWGCGVRRSLYESSLPLLGKYYEVLAGTPYFRRDSDSIRSVLLELGLEVNATSQDFVKGRIASHLGFTGVSTYGQLGRYIGRSGEHKSLLTSLFRHRGLFNTRFDTTWSVSTTDIQEFLERPDTTIQ